MSYADSPAALQVVRLAIGTELRSVVGVPTAPHLAVVPSLVTQLLAHSPTARIMHTCMRRLRQIRSHHRHRLDSDREVICHATAVGEAPEGGLIATATADQGIRGVVGVMATAMGRTLGSVVCTTHMQCTLPFITTCSHTLSSPTRRHLPSSLTLCSSTPAIFYPWNLRGLPPNREYTITA